MSSLSTILKDNEPSPEAKGSRYIFDIETNGFLRDCTHIHCIGLYDIDTHQTFVFNDEGTEEPVARAITYLEEAYQIIGHNIVGYDIPVIKKLFPWFEPHGQVMDTLLLSRLYHPDLLQTDKRRRWKDMPLKLYGRHSLEAYGYRLGTNKGDFGKDTDWKHWSQEMQDYMVQDVNVTTKLWDHFQPYLNGSR